jgi:DNA primase
MPGRISQRVIQQILDRVNLVELIGQQVKLRKSGRNFAGLCPFHSDGSPSFYVNSEKGFFHCFGCKENGNAISYLMKTRGMSYPEAIESLAGSVGIEVEYEEGSRESWQKSRDRRRLLFEINQVANAYFRTSLASTSGTAGQEYLAGRKLEARVLSAFQVGFAPQGAGLYNLLVRKGLQLNLASELGLIGAGRTGEWRDRMTERVMFPILTVTDDVAGFSGRMLPGGRDPKYLNSPDSDVFRKGELLFGLVQARERIKREDFCILVEGQVDVLSMHQAGFENTVAPLGTALTEHQALVLRRFTTNVALMFDGDAAGIKATWRAIPLLMNQGLTGKVVVLPAADDPDSLALKGGAEAIRTAVTAARPFLDYAVETLVAQAGKSMHGRSKAAKAGLEFAAQIASPIDRQIFTDQLAAELGLPPESLRVEALGATADAGPRQPASPPLSQSERVVVEAVLHKPELARLICQEDLAEVVSNQAVRKLLHSLVDALEEFGSVEPHEIVARIEDLGLRDCCAGLLLHDQPKDPTALEKAVVQLLPRMKLKSLKRSRDELRSQLKGASVRGEDEQVWDLYRRLGELDGAIANLERARS